MNKYQAVIGSYARAALVAVATLFVTSPDASTKELIQAALIAILAPVLRALNPDDTQFGIGAKKKK
jgi:multisubunit Na+/H+ antiporter MnhG subunit